MKCEGCGVGENGECIVGEYSWDGRVRSHRRDWKGGGRDCAQLLGGGGDWGASQLGVGSHKLNNDADVCGESYRGNG